jgi:hypothetical protein
MAWIIRILMNLFMQGAGGGKQRRHQYQGDTEKDYRDSSRFGRIKMKPQRLQTTATLARVEVFCKAIFRVFKIPKIPPSRVIVAFNARRIQGKFRGKRFRPVSG